jgi:hypothetical protein
MIESKIVGGSRNTGARVTQRGQLVVAPLEYSRFYTGTATLVNTAVNLVKPQTHKKFVITDIIISSNRDVGVNGAIVDIYEALSPSTTTVTREIYQDEVAKQTRASLIGLNVLIVDEGRWINFKTDDASVRCNLAGYYIDGLDLDDDSENKLAE